MSALLRALRLAAREAGRTHRRTGSARFALADAKNAGEQALRLQVQRLPNNAALILEPHTILPTSPVDVSWRWTDVGYLSGLDAGRTRRQVAETMQAALQDVGRRAITRMPRQYNFVPMTAGHARLYRRMADQLRNVYRYDEQGLTPRPLAYALYLAQQGARGAGAAGTGAALMPQEAR